MVRQIFYQANPSRWRRLRLALNVAGVATTLLIGFFWVSLNRAAELNKLYLPEQRRAFRPVKARVVRRSSPHRRRPEKLASDVPLNSGDPIRAAFYDVGDAASFASLKEYAHQIDLLFPDFLHVTTPDGHLQYTSEDGRQELPVIENVAGNQRVATIDTKVMPFLASEKLPTEVFPMIQNFDPRNGTWVDMGPFFGNEGARANFREQLGKFLGTDRFRGAIIDFEEVGPHSQPGYNALIGDLSNDLHARGMKLYVAAPAHNEDFNYKFLAAQTDGIVIMNYDEHFPDGAAGPIASQDWFVSNLRAALKVIPREKLICGIPNYGYDWPAKRTSDDERPHNVSAQDAWRTAQESEEGIDFDSDALNPHFAYVDEQNVRHDVWFTDAVTALNEMRAARNLGIGTFALWRLGEEDRSIWSVWDRPRDPKAAEQLKTIPPGHDVDTEGRGEVLQITARPADGARDVTEDARTHLITDEELTKTPVQYQLSESGAPLKEVAITFDDGPDSQWTPKVLDVLKREHAPAAFFLIGASAEQNPGLLKRIYREGHEIGNHTWSHPDISEISPGVMKFELNATERLFEAELGVKPIFFRPPYSIDANPDIDDEVRPLQAVQDFGLTTVGSNNDPYDWREYSENGSRHTAEQITEAVLSNLPPCPADANVNPHCGNIILLHDGGGNRAETVKALPAIIEGVRQRGFQIVPVSELIGQTRAQVMTPLTANERWMARLDRVGFWGYRELWVAIVFIFWVGDALMSLRFLVIGAFALYDRFRKRSYVVPNAGGNGSAPVFEPPIAVLVPAYNEEKVIARTVRAVLGSTYPNLRVIVIDDGSRDGTLRVSREEFASEIAEGRVLVLTKPNSGKAEALNFGLQYVTEEIYVGIDADTVIARDAIERLVPHFVDPSIGAVAGNAKVGNRVNLWTRWQALEYITSQNFERRALNTLNAVTVVPGALGAWRTEAVHALGAYHADTVAEDADLTMSLLEHGYSVQYEDRALAFTEAPVSAGGLIRQRFRWSFGILQAVWKHRGVVGRKGVLGFIALPNIFIFQILLPLVSPFIDIMFVATALIYVMNKHFHPESADASSFHKVMLFFLTFLIIDFLTSVAAFALERRDADNKEDLWLLGDIWLQRFTYRQLFSVVLFKTVKRAVDGRSFNWDKLERTAKLTYAQSPKQPQTVTRT
jgi:cellulose synthase/poly-beta-1,6-N-acetylglucosamine synthase-like glycosyltransferase/peptidoglycan/xylan/chitin deacetylase (PgdA/CDA1 family)